MYLDIQKQLVKKDDNKMKKSNNKTNNRELRIGNKVLCRYFNSMDKTYNAESFEGIIIAINHNVKSANPAYYGELETMYKVKMLDCYSQNVVLHQKEITQVLEKSQIDYNNYWNTFELFVPDYGMRKQGSFEYCLDYLLEGNE